MMSEFDILMDSILDFLNVDKDDELIKEIKITSEKQNNIKVGTSMILKNLV